ncbi:hypothetical protein A2164_02530 [Candidatus Curtissbacteria bacterium RBG_13_35_7]|uniref:HIT domain-containing protein n=1 Tax=Candidatus Curtissbacteria bacterium RBG_13_35_7 TaxID=1797705 RepID=A0A1F5G322_9BACT|nr:MAG: hypothetical protein A2164_02530 [Candidatus Curtissbacteria bacterium RBG_13_35_7]
MTSRDCIFCKIIKGEINSKLIMETDKVIAFGDINPVANVHILIVPKKHIESVATINRDDGADLVEMFNVAVKLANDKKLDAYRLSYNAGRYQHVGHLHMHLLAGSKIEWSKL